MIKKAVSKKIKDMTLYPIEDAVKKIKESSKEGFNSTVEIHINLDLDVTKQEQNVRYTIVLPHGTGKTKKVAVLASKKIEGADLELTEQDIEKLENGKLRPKVDFDVLVSEPRFMAKLAKAARVLGPAGVMPNPKNGTVSEDVDKAVEQIKKGKIEIKTEKDAAVIHTITGKVSFSDEQLTANIKEILRSLNQNRPSKATPEWIKSVVLCSTMGPSFRIKLA